jgi:hypothetical protein
LCATFLLLLDAFFEAAGAFRLPPVWLMLAALPVLLAAPSLLTSRWVGVSGEVFVRRTIRDDFEMTSSLMCKPSADAE